MMEKENTDLPKQAKPEQADHPEQDLAMVAQPERVPLTPAQINGLPVWPHMRLIDVVRIIEAAHHITKKE